MLAIFDKPDPFDGPFRGIAYVTPSRSPAEVQNLWSKPRRREFEPSAYEWPRYAEMRYNDAGVWLLEIAAPRSADFAPALYASVTGYRWKK